MPAPFHSVSINPDPGKGELVVLFSGHAQTAPLHKVGPQVLDYYLVHYVLSGEGTFSCLGREYRVGRGGSFFIFPGELVSYVSDEQNPWLYRWIGFKGNDAERLLAQLGISAHTPVIEAGDFRRVRTLYGAIERTLRMAPAGCDLTAGGYMRLLLGEYARERIPHPEDRKEGSKGIQQQVEQAIRWLTLQYSQPISIESMSQTLGYHRTHLSKMFKQYTGMSPMAFLLKIRMERAKILLHEDLTIEQIASSVGFSDPLYFSKQFKKWHGCSPSEYRLSLQGKERFDCSQ